MKTITIEVTADDIARGTRKSCSCCPIALALARCTGLVVSVESDWVYFMPDLPQTAVEFIKTFDAGKPVQPFSFELDVPEVK